MDATACTSFASHRRIARARAWLMARAPAEELLIIGANLDAANELARAVAQTTGGAFGWHRFTLTQLAAALAAPTMAARGIVPAGRLGVEAIVCRAVHALSPGGALGRYACIAKAPGFPRAIANVLTEIRLAAVGPEVLGKVAPDLLLLLRAYENTNKAVCRWKELLAEIRWTNSETGRHLKDRDGMTDVTEGSLLAAVRMPTPLDFEATVERAAAREVRSAPGSFRSVLYSRRVNQAGGKALPSSPSSPAVAANSSCSPPAISLALGASMKSDFWYAQVGT